MSEGGSSNASRPRVGRGQDRVNKCKKVRHGSPILRLGVGGGGEGEGGPSQAQ